MNNRQKKWDETRKNWNGHYPAKITYKKTRGYKIYFADTPNDPDEITILRADTSDGIPYSVRRIDARRLEAAANV